MIGVFIRFIVFLVVLAGLGVGGFWYANQLIEAPGPAASGDAEETIVLLERGIGLKTIAGRLEEAGIVRDADLFAYYVKITGDGGRLRAGEYAFPSRASMAEVLEILKTGKSIMHKVTVPEGLTSIETVRIINANETLEGDPVSPPAEGTLLPETYLFQRGTTRDELVARMAKAHDDAIAELWPGRVDGLPFDTEEEAITLASIVEKETAVADERERVAGVFVNRLKRGIPLQSDPTVIYAITMGDHKQGGKGPLGRRLLTKDLEETDSPYNTYKYRGLPPGPIANPGHASLAAVLNPEQHKYLYFVADGTGGHVFAKTLAEHNRNVQNWRKIRKQQSQSSN